MTIFWSDGIENIPPTRRCEECGRILSPHEGILCDDCEGEAFAEDEWIEENC